MLIKITKKLAIDVEISYAINYSRISYARLSHVILYHAYMNYCVMYACIGYMGKKNMNQLYVGNAMVYERTKTKQLIKHYITSARFNIEIIFPQ